MYNPIKRSVHPLYITVMLLAAMAGSLTTLHLFHLKYKSGPSPRTLKKTIFSETLLIHAAIDMADLKLKQDIDDLMESDFVVTTPGWKRSFLSSSGSHRSTRVIRQAGETLQRLGSIQLPRLWSTFKKCLSDWSRKREAYRPGGMMSELVDGVKFLFDEYNGLQKGLYNSCAVVGNSGILLESEHGELIDSHEVVIRLNNARTDGFKRNVGSKTNISFVNSNILHLCAFTGGCFCHPYGARVPTVMYLCQPVHFSDYLVCKSSHLAPLIVTDPRFDVLCARIAKYYSLKRFVETTGKGVGKWAAAHGGEEFHYSSGMQAVMLALGVCERVSLFGFGKSELANHHYHTRQRAELSLHDYEAEYDFYRDLVAGAGVAPFVSDKFEFPPVVMYH